MKDNQLFVELSFEEASTIKGGGVTLFNDIDFRGEKLTTLGNPNRTYVGNDFNDQASSIKVAGGTWRFYTDANYKGDHWDLGPGEYPWVGLVGIPNDSISSFELISGPGF
ncbi:MAG: beta/gamma crystallin-related protein [Nostoc sp. DedQUE05]|uniref:beta/gamma crystallin-related protein n=1 Tax=Nostoc sp. DedQUE05 TaxID=3075391 RepID=UPI002AD25069|nr:beta/gamma crystallin-related protein [Nostoc sp. DedQUE05]MDZ8091006.1 beta/gamma crystallin-related protein [Nostoc sp. DedQUE05]